MTQDLKQIANSVIAAGEKASQKDWKSTPSLIGHRLENSRYLIPLGAEEADYLALSANNAERLARAVLILSEALQKISIGTGQSCWVDQSIATNALAKANEVMK